MGMGQGHQEPAMGPLPVQSLLQQLQRRPGITHAQQQPRPGALARAWLLGVCLVGAEGLCGLIGSALQLQQCFGPQGLQLNRHGLLGLGLSNQGFNFFRQAGGIFNAAGSLQQQGFRQSHQGWREIGLDL